MGNLVLLTFEANNRYSNQGTPAAYFDNTNCDFAAHFGPMNIIINLAFCTWRSNFLLPVYDLSYLAGGGLANSRYSSDGCPSTCFGEPCIVDLNLMKQTHCTWADYVDSNPEAFSKAYFEFNALNIYQ